MQDGHAAPRRGFLLTLALPALAGCVQPLGQPYLGGFGDPVRGAALNAPWHFGDMPRYAGSPRDAALATVQLEFLADTLNTDPYWSPLVSGTVQVQLRMARQDLRAAIGIAPEAPPAVVMGALRTAADALAQGSPARAEAALAPPVFVPGGRATLQRLASLPRLPRLTEAAAAVSNEIYRIDSRR